MLLVAELNKKFIKRNIVGLYKKIKNPLDKINVVRSVVPSITHVDCTARIQTVNQKTNKLYYNLIKEFKKLVMSNGDKYKF